MSNGLSVPGLLGFGRSPIPPERPGEGGRENPVSGLGRSSINLGFGKTWFGKAGFGKAGFMSLSVPGLLGFGRSLIPPERSGEGGRENPVSGLGFGKAGFGKDEFGAPGLLVFGRSLILPERSGEGEEGNLISGLPCRSSIDLGFGKAGFGNP